MSDPDSQWNRDYKRQLEIGEFRVDPGALVVHGDGDPIRLKPKAMAVLLELARQPGITLTREELLDRVWKSTYVTQGVLGHAITALRRAFGDTLDSPRYIETIPRIGYRLLAAVRVLDDADPIGVMPDQSPQTDRLDDPVMDAHHDASSLDTAEADTTGREAVDASSPVDAPPQALDAVDTAKSRRRHHRPGALLAAAALVFAIIVPVGAGWWRSTAVEQLPDATTNDKATVRDVTAVSARRLTFATGSENNPRLNATGDWLVYTAADRLGARPHLMLQSAIGTIARPLAGADSADRPTWAPDGRRIAYVSSDSDGCAIRIATVDRPGEQTVLPCSAGSTVYVDWNPVDAKVMAYTAADPGDSGGSAVQLLVDRRGWHVDALRYDRPVDAVDLYPRYSPDGRRIAFRRGTNPTSDLYVMSARGGTVTRVTHVRAQINGFDWLADGTGLVMSSNHEGIRQLYTVALDTGEASPLGIVNASSPDVAPRAQRMTYQQDDWSSSLSEVTIAPGSVSRALAPSSGRDSDAAMSRDGARIVFVSDRDDTQQLWALDVRSGRAERLTRHAGMTVNAPVLSADGQRVLYVTRARGRHELWEYDLRAKTRIRLASSGTSINNAVYGGDDRSVWFARWQGIQWSLFGCARVPGVAACTERDTGVAAKRVERSRLRDEDVLVLASPQSARRLQIVRERDLAVIGSIEQPKGDSWEAIDGAVWSLASSDTGGHDVTTLTRDALDGSAPRVLATWSGLHPLKYAGFAVSPDGRRIILPVVTRDSTDLAYTVLARAARTGPSRRVERAAP